MTEALTPALGLAVLHLFCKVTPLADAAEVVAAAEGLLAQDRPTEVPGDTEVEPDTDDATGTAADAGTATEVEVEAEVLAEAKHHQLVSVALLGHKADVGFLAIGPDLWRLRKFQTDVEAAGLSVVDSYLSLTEVSEYAAGLPAERRQMRLYPKLPPEGKPAFCFYPMSKRRGETYNWYTLEYPDREKLMFGHGGVGRTFAGRVLQLVTGSTGLDDHEWGVTLFGGRPDDLKDCVYTMRYDEASSRYAEFGSFYTGVVAELHEVLTAVGVRG
jgi:chlorite dismutase